MWTTSRRGRIARIERRIGDLEIIPYCRQGDERLAGAIREAAVRHSAVLLANHGPVIAGKSLTDALYALEELEETAKLHLLLPDTIHGP